jgi:hypothetical protein
MSRGMIYMLIVAAAATTLVRSAAAVNFTASYTDGGSWGESGLYAQGFNPFVHNPPDPGLAEGATAYLTNFRFFKSGLADAATNIRLAIVNNIFLNLQGLTAEPGTPSAALVGLSTNAIANTSSLATGAPFDFQFSGLPLTYSGDLDGYYAAIFVNVGAAGELTPVLVSTLRANYVETPAGSGTFLPQTNYGDPDPAAPLDNRLACSNFTHTDAFGTYFDTFNGYADANFIATFSTTVPTLPGNYDGDGNVDGADLAKWREGFGQSVVLDADGDGDGDVDGADFLTWQRGLGAGTPSVAAAAAIPEPTTLSLALGSLATGALLRRRRTDRAK